VAFVGPRRDRRNPGPKRGCSRFSLAQHRWTPSTNVGAVASVQRAAVPGREHPGLPAVELDELDIWQYIRLENHPHRAAVFRGERPVSSARASLIMVDDDRLRSSPASAGRADGAIPDARVLPAHRPLRARPTHCPRSCGDAAHLARSAWAASSIVTPTHPGGQERRVFLMSHVANDLLVSDIDAYLQRHDTKTMLRFSSPAECRRREEHALPAPL